MAEDDVARPIEARKLAASLRRVWNGAMRKLLKLVVVLAALLVVAAVLLVVFVDRAAKKAIEESGTYALGTETTLESADIGLTSGRVQLDDLAVANPKGFEREHFLRIGQVQVAMPFQRVLDARIELDRLEISGLEVALERREGKTNYDTILDNLSRLSKKDGKPKEPTEGGKQIVLREIVLRDLTAHVDLLPVGGELTRTTIRVPEVRLENVGNDMTIAEAIGVVVRACIQAVIEGGATQIPGELLKDLTKKLPAVGDVVVKVSEGVQATVETVAREAGKVLEGAANEAGKLLEDAAKGVEGVFKKKD